MTSFLFYDIETTGLNSAFDQILTFAAIRTDTDLNEIERHSLTMRMRPDIVPSPGAFIIHRLMPEDWAQGICEYEGASIIHAIVNLPGTISIGYNSLGFDDEFLRFTFYRNLFNPYSHQYANGCYRIDLLPIATLYRIFKPDIINWPLTDKHKSSLKLELISNANNFRTSGRSHNAMADVEATVALAKCLIKEKEMWSYCFDFFDKNREKIRIDKIYLQPPTQDYPCAVMVSHKLGADSTYIAPVLSIGRSYHYANQSLWLRLDRDIIRSSVIMNTEEIFAIRKKDGETGIILPPLPRFWDRLSDEQRASAEMNISIINESKRNQAILNKIAEYHRQFKYPLVPEADLDSVLYQSPFFTNAEKREMERFHKSPVDEKIAIVDFMKPSRIKSLAIRILFRNYFNKDKREGEGFLYKGVKDIHDSMPLFILREYESYMERVRGYSNDPNLNTKKIVGFKRDERLVPQKALEELKNILREIVPYNANKISDGEEQPNVQEKKDSEHKQRILKWLENYISSI